MAKWLIGWKTTQQFLSLPQEERMKLVAAQLDMIKASMDAGLIRDWGIKAGGDEGYALMEGTETQIYEDLVRYSPTISFEATPVLSVAQLSETMKKLAATMGK